MLRGLGEGMTLAWSNGPGHRKVPRESQKVQGEGDGARPAPSSGHLPCPGVGRGWPPGWVIQAPPKRSRGRGTAGVEFKWIFKVQVTPFVLG